ncbi:MAG: hypothetical protein WCL39_06590 [Armatimonadota bacterium]
MRYPAITAVLFCCVLAGCGRDDSKTISGFGKMAKIEQTGKTTRVTVEGLGKDSAVINVTQTAVIKEIGLPLYPGARIDPGSEVCAVSKEMKTRSCRAKLRTADAQEKVVDFYRLKMATGPMTLSISGNRISLLVKTYGDGKRTVRVSRKKGTNVTRIELVSIEPLAR